MASGERYVGQLCLKNNKEVVNLHINEASAQQKNQYDKKGNNRIQLKLARMDHVAKFEPKLAGSFIIVRICIQTCISTIK